MAGRTVVADRSRQRSDHATKRHNASLDESPVPYDRLHYAIRAESVPDLSDCCDVVSINRNTPRVQ